MDASSAANMLAFANAMEPMFVEIERIAGYRAPKQVSERFTTLREHLTDAAPAALTHLNSVWLTRFRSALASLQQGICAAHYHMDRIEQMEREVVRIAQRWATPEFPVGSCAAGGNVMAMTYEYQAFAFALRRALEYLARLLGAYFKTDVRSIRTVTRTIKDHEPEAIARRIRSVFDTQVPTLHDIIPDDRSARRSVRDQLAHQKSVDAGIFNLSRGTEGWLIAFVGGGNQIPQRLKSSPGEAGELSPEVSTALHEQFNRVWAFIEAVLEAMSLDAAGV